MSDHPRSIHPSVPVRPPLCSCSFSVTAIRQVGGILVEECCSCHQSRPYESVLPKPDPFVRCKYCGANSIWDELPFGSRWQIDNDLLELRPCPCGTTLSRRVDDMVDELPAETKRSAELATTGE